MMSTDSINHQNQQINSQQSNSNNLSTTTSNSGGSGSLSKTTSPSNISPVASSGSLVSKNHLHTHNYPNISHFKASQHILARHKQQGNTNSHGIATIPTHSSSDEDQPTKILTFSGILYSFLTFVISFLPSFLIEKLLTFFAWVQLELLRAKAKNINPDQTYSKLKQKRKLKKKKHLQPVKTLTHSNNKTPITTTTTLTTSKKKVIVKPTTSSTTSNKTIIQDGNHEQDDHGSPMHLSDTESTTSQIPTLIVEPSSSPDNNQLYTSSTSNTHLKPNLLSNHSNPPPITNSTSNSSSSLLDHPELLLRHNQLSKLPTTITSSASVGDHLNHLPTHHAKLLALPDTDSNHSSSDDSIMGHIQQRQRSDSLSEPMCHETGLPMNRSFAEIRRVNSEATLYQTSEDTLLFEANQQSRKEFEDFLRSVKDIKDVRNWLQNFSGSATRKIAIVKISRRILETQYGIDQAASSLCFMFKFGLLPVVIHGGLNDITRLPYDQVVAERRARSAQLKEAIKKNGVGSTVLTPDICEIHPVIDNSDDHSPDESSDTLSEEELEFGKSGMLPNGGLNFAIDSFDYDLLTQALDKGKIPIWDSVAETAAGVEIPINSDVTTFELAKRIQPFKIIFACNDGGILDVDHKAIPVVYLDQDYHHLVEAKHTTERRRVQLKQMKRIVDNLPSSTALVVTSIESITHQLLFPRLANGTIVKRREENKVLTFDRTNFEQVDLKRLRVLIEDSFGRALSEDYFDYLRENLYKLYLCISADDEYNGCAIVTFKKPDYIPYLCKFCVQKSAQGLGLGDLIWRILQRDIDQLYWRSRNNNPLNPWYFQRCQGSFRADEHFTVFWYGDDKKFEESGMMIEEALRKPITVLPNPKG